MTPPIVVCTLGSPSLEVLRASIAAYAPDTEFFSAKFPRSTFGQCYNELMAEVFSMHYDEILIANDDIVLHPNTLTELMEDVAICKARHGDKLGLVSVHSDYVRPAQDIRLYARCELREVPVIAPILAWISKKAFNDAPFPPLNWYSDDIQCFDLTKKGYHHYVSRAYVHHAGSQTVGRDNQRLHNEAVPWILTNRPDFFPSRGMHHVTQTTA